MSRNYYCNNENTIANSIDIAAFSVDSDYCLHVHSCTETLDARTKENRFLLQRRMFHREIP